MHGTEPPTSIGYETTSSIRGGLSSTVSTHPQGNLPAFALYRPCYSPGATTDALLALERSRGARSSRMAAVSLLFAPSSAWASDAAPVWRTSAPGSADRPCI